MIRNDHGITIKQLKDYIMNLPEKDSNGEDYEVWVAKDTKSGTGLSNYVVEICKLNEGDILLTYSP